MSSSQFAPDAFFTAAREALSRRIDVSGGDHVLNPDLEMEPAEYRDAAVLIPVVSRHPEATVLLTLRTPHLSSHAGQIAFPGGKIDPTDNGPAGAAIREAEEEIGLDPRSVRLIGALSPYLSRTGYRIVPVVGSVRSDYSLHLNEHEVADAFEVPLSFLMDPSNHVLATRVFQGRERSFYEIPFEDHYIWGVTAGIIRGLYEQVYR